MKYKKRVEGRYSELEMVVFYDYTPPQAETLTDPSWPEEIDINAVCIDGVNIDDWITKEKMDLLEEECLLDFHESKRDLLDVLADQINQYIKEELSNV